MKHLTRTVTVYDDSFGYYDATVEIHSLRGNANCDPFSFEIERQLVTNEKQEIVAEKDLPEGFWEVVDKSLLRCGCPFRDKWPEEIETSLS